MKKVRVLLSLVLLTAVTEICRADNPVDLKQENTELKQRVDKLEKEVEELKRLVMQPSQAGMKPVTQPAPATGSVVAEPAESNVAPLKLSEEDTKKLMAMLEEKEKTKKKPVWSDLDIQLYGRLKLDAAYDTSRMEVGDYAKWVRPHTNINHHSEFNMTANETRLGLNISGPETDGVKTSGRVEIDFYGGGAENKANLMMRHAYINIEWPAERFSILAGQTSDVISPLSPNTLNYSVDWWAGNIGYRRPQIRLTKSYALGQDVDLKLEVAATRNIGISSGSFVVRDTGEDSGIPGLQGRASVQFPWLKDQPTIIGVSGHWAKEKFYTSAAGANQDYRSWSLNLDATQPINEWLALKGELFTGENLSAYLGGIGNGVNTVLGREISSSGGWVAASLTPRPKWNFNFGIGVDDPKSGDLAGMSATDARDYNRSIFGNAIYSISKNTEVGFELSQWHTEYRGAGNADAIRAQTSFIYKF